MQRVETTRISLGDAERVRRHDSSTMPPLPRIRRTPRRGTGGRCLKKQGNSAGSVMCSRCSAASGLPRGSRNACKLFQAWGVLEERAATVQMCGQSRRHE